jgi:aminoacylase
VQRLQEFIQIKSVSGEGSKNGAYNEASDWLVKRAEAIGLSVEVIEPVENKPIVIMTWVGTQPGLPCVILNSHYDVVPVMEEFWDMDAFGGVRQEDPDQARNTHRIYGRGTQDMKSVCVQYLEAIGQLKASGFAPLRTLYLTYVPDEEIGGTDGMGVLMKHEKWQQMQPVGLALDEGLANPGKAYTLFYGERTPWWVNVKATGPTGHGSRFIDNTAVSKLMDVANKGLEFRKEQETLLGHDEGGCKHGQAKKLGDVTTLNLTMLKAGVSTDGGETYALNVIPTDAELGFDIRIATTMPTKAVAAKLDEWTAAEGVSWGFPPKWNAIHDHYTTSIDPHENPWARVFFSACAELEISLEPEIFPAATDSRFLRQVGVNAFGFSPMNRSPILLHEHNEYIHEDVYLEGVGVYVKLVEHLTMAPRFEQEAEAPPAPPGPI